MNHSKSHKRHSYKRTLVGQRLWKQRQQSVIYIHNWGHLLPQKDKLEFLFILVSPFSLLCPVSSLPLFAGVRTGGQGSPHFQNKQNAQLWFAWVVLDSPGTSAPSATHKTASLFLCNAQDESRTFEGRRVTSKSPSLVQAAVRNGKGKYFPDEGSLIFWPPSHLMIAALPDS